MPVPVPVPVLDLPQTLPITVSVSCNRFINYVRRELSFEIGGKGDGMK